MTDETTKTREQELMEEFKDGLEPTAATALQLRIDELMAENKKLDDELGCDEQEKIDLEEEAQKLQKDLDAANARVEALQADLDAANAKAAKAVTATKAKVTRGDTTPKPRKFGPVDDGLSGDALVEALQQADADDKRVEIVVADGTREVTGIPPIVVTGDVWRPHMLGLMLKEPVKVDGAQPGGTSFVVAGFALLIDGKQVAYCRRSNVVQVAPGQTVSFADDIYF